ncbi:putative pentapeptide [Helianthus annuus]|uniref:Pentapeptide n=1 Tax=Helianthus annuus TaxID=4232 RepID=A0A251U5C6_HELAN|nr:thylakoid lumenal 15 kDa protein 1, chloroplastic [Helianthus annuus]KAF5794901.1 putative pentapeptide [Helianthus annuus]KAJ0538476.1 putative thylakoid lumenal 15kDa protein [Helianthus annuus]KAJ0546366.1 putative pentapeptide [Helianthus annuus]KAJ0553106.1 putative thylakoid lumenal 15kDa protein [Helianthus annuus]KAJ0722023.1 putative thylakoid lumenal 15kDa protein [Helianthus annuus]
MNYPSFFSPTNLTMAVLNFALCCLPPSKLSSLPFLQIPNSSHGRAQIKFTFTDDSSINLASKACITALISASLFFAADPALAFKGGGPYGSEVTRGQDLTGKDFSGKTLIKQDFKTSILRQANFKAAKLVGASFFDADLTGADLSDADLRGADFSLANVTKANLTNANLEGALVTGNTSFKGSIITGADFTDVPLREDQKEYLCKIADGVNPTTGNDTRETLFCK